MLLRVRRLFYMVVMIKVVHDGDYEVGKRLEKRGRGPVDKSLISLCEIILVLKILYEVKLGRRKIQCNNNSKCF